MKLLFVLDNNCHAIFDGISQHVVQLVNCFKEDKHMTIDYLFANHKLPLNIRLPTKRAFNKLNRDFDVVHFHGFNSTFIILLAFFANKNKRCKWVYTPHMHPFSKNTRPILNFIFFHVFSKFMLKKIDHLIVLSNREYDFYSKFVNTDIISIIPNGISAVKERPLPKKHRKHFLFVGRYDKGNKRPQIIEKIALYFPDYKFVFVIGKFLPSHDNIAYKAKVSAEELDDLYANSFATLIPSKYESFSIVALESLANGTPIIIAPNVQIKQYLSDNLKILLKEDRLEESLIDAIKQILTLEDDLFYQHCQEGINRAKGFLWCDIAKKVLNTYTKV